MDEGAPEPKYNEEIQGLIERSLSGNITKLHELDATIRKLCTVVDSIEDIVPLVKSFLRQSIKIHFELDQSTDAEDRQFMPIPPNEYEGDAIFKHPDAHNALEALLVYIQSELQDILEAAGKLDADKRREADNQLDLIIENFEDPSAEGKLINFLEKEAGAAGDSERQWRLIIQSYMATTATRDYHKEYLEKARKRWMEGVITEKDLALGFVDLVNFTLDESTVDFLVEQAVNKSTKEVIYDAVTSKELEAGTLNRMRNMLIRFDKDPNIKRENLRAWFRSITKRMTQKQIRIEEDTHDV